MPGLPISVVALRGPAATLGAEGRLRESLVGLPRWKEPGRDRSSLVMAVLMAGFCDEGRLAPTTGCTLGLPALLVAMSAGLACVERGLALGARIVGRRLDTPESLLPAARTAVSLEVEAWSGLEPARGHMEAIDIIIYHRNIYPGYETY